MPIINKPNMNYGVWAEGGNIEIPSSEKVEQGWIIEKPLNETMNWLQNRQDRMLQYLNQRGLPEWDTSTEYPINSYINRNGVVYIAVSQNQDADPTLNQDIWNIAFVSYEDFVEYVNTLNSVTTEDGFLEFYVKKSDPVLDAPAKGIAYNNTTNVSGLAFEGTKPKIVTDGETIVEFGDGLSPKDVVTHEQLALAIQNYKVGDIYITTSNGDPSGRLGYGTWERFAEGETLVGFSSDVSNEIPEWVKTEGGRSGNYENTIEFPYSNWDVDGLEVRTTRQGVLVVGSGFKENQEILESLNQPRVNQQQTISNVQPSIIVYFWKRIS